MKELKMYKNTNNKTKLQKENILKTKSSIKKQVKEKRSETYTNIFQAYKAFWKRGFSDWKGTSSRSEFWLATLFNLILLVVPLFVILFCQAIGVKDQSVLTFFMVVLCLLALYGLAVFIPTLSMGIRRFHDFGQPAWLYVLLSFSLGVSSFADLRIVSNLLGIMLLVLCALPTKISGNPYHKYNKYKK